MVVQISADKSPSPVGGLMLLEHLHGSVRCESEKAPKLLGVSQSDSEAIFVQARCKQWACEPCGKINTAQWVARVLTGLNHYIENGIPDWYLMTITSHENCRSVASSLKNLRRGWRKLSNRMWRKFGKFKYVKIYEHHENGAFHMHLVCSVKIPYTVSDEYVKKHKKVLPVYRCKWLKDNARGCGMGYMDDYRPIINPGIAAGYVVKYLGKSVGELGRDWPTGMRRIQTSHFWPALPEMPQKSGYNWELINNHPHLMQKAALLWKLDGILVTDVKTGKIYNTDDFEAWV